MNENQRNTLVNYLVTLDKQYADLLKIQSDMKHFDQYASDVHHIEIMLDYNVRLRYRLHNHLNKS